MKKTFKVEGMHCASCARNIEKELTGAPGVEQAVVNLTTEKLMLEYDEAKADLADLKHRVEAIGFKIEEQSRVVKLKIEGMHCASCSANIEKTLGGMKGIFDAQVNLTTEIARVTFDEKVISLGEIYKAVENIGFKASLVEKVGTLEGKEQEIQKQTIKLIIAVSFMLPLLYLAMAPMLGMPIPDFLSHMDHPLAYALTQLILLTPILIVGKDFFRTGLKLLLKRKPNMDSLIAVGTGSAIVYSLYTFSLILGGSHDAMDGLFFETAGMIITLIYLGKYLENRAKLKTADSLKRLYQIAPKTATRIRVEDGLEEEVLIDDLLVGDLLIVRPGSKVPIDGTVETGDTHIDESMLTGESMPVRKEAGSPVFGGTLNKEGSIRFKVTKDSENTALANIIRFIEDAQATKAPIAKLADVVAGWFVPVVIGVAALALVSWLVAGADFQFALKIFISILVIACPCALGLATPTAIMVATGKGAELGILIKGGEALEQANRIDAVVFDKTGTLTVGRPRLTDLQLNEGFKDDQVLMLAASLENASEHPLKEAFGGEGLKPLKCTEFRTLPGYGIEGKVEGALVLMGKEELLIGRGIDTTPLRDSAAALSGQGRTLVFIAADGRLAALAGIADPLKDEVPEVIAELAELGIETWLLTGDNRQTAEAIGAEAGITRIHANVLPTDKAGVIKEIQQGGKIVAMVGDGINDAPALVQSDVGIAVGGGTDIAMDSADIVLVRNDLRDILTAIRLSRKTLVNIKQNLFWAFFYNVIGIPLAAGIFYIFGGPLLNPIFAALAMSLSSVSVVSNALRLKTFKIKKKP